MATQYALIDKDTLKLIRETRNVSFEYAARITKYDSSKIMCWEDSQNVTRPTIRQAKDLARCYRIPFAGLYMIPQYVPVEKLPKILNKRKIWGAIEEDNSALNLAIFDLLRLRKIVLDTKAELGEPIEHFTFSGNLNDAVVLAGQLRKYLGISYEMQKATSSHRKLFLLVRSKVEQKGTMVAGFEKVELEVARGISLYFDDIPIIGVNDDDRPPAKTFSIIHELVHIFKRTSTMCNEINSFSSDVEEVFCNAVAGEFLVPALFLEKEPEVVNQNDIDDHAIEVISTRYSVSREVIIRRLLDLGYLQRPFFEEKMEQYKIEREKEKEEQKIASKNGQSTFRRSVPRDTFDKNGSSVCESLYNGFNQGIYSQWDVSNFLGVKPIHIPKLFEEVIRW